MYVPHHDVMLVPAELQGPEYELDGQKIPQVSVSASRDKNGRIHVSLCNLSPATPVRLSCDLEGGKVGAMKGRVLTAPEINAHNTFERPEAVKPAPFDDFTPTQKGFETTLPAKSIVVLEL